MQNLIIIVIVIFALMMFMNSMKIKEGYRTNVPGSDFYYKWRTYNHLPRSPCSSAGYPYNYKPHAYHGRFDYYGPMFKRYGYGHW